MFKMLDNFIKYFSALGPIPLHCLKKKMQHPQSLCSLAPRYNMCLVRGCSVGDSFVTVNSDQMALRRPVFLPSVVPLQAVTVVLREFILLLNNFSHFNEFVLQVCVRLNGHIPHLQTRFWTATWYRYTWDRRTAWVTVAAWTASREEIWAHVAFAVSTRTIGNHLLAAGLRSCVPLTRLPLTPLHHQAWLLWCCERVDWRVEWQSVVFSDESRFCLHLSDRCTHVDIDLVSVIFWRAFAHDTQVPPQAS